MLQPCSLDAVPSGLEVIKPFYVRVLYFLQYYINARVQHLSPSMGCLACILAFPCSFKQEWLRTAIKSDALVCSVPRLSQRRDTRASSIWLAEEGPEAY